MHVSHAAVLQDLPCSHYETGMSPGCTNNRSCQTALCEADESGIYFVERTVHENTISGKDAASYCMDVLVQGKASRIAANTSSSAFKCSFSG